MCVKHDPDLAELDKSSSEYRGKMTLRRCPINAIHIIPSEAAEEPTYVYVPYGEATGWKLGYSKLSHSLPYTSFMLAAADDDPGDGYQPLLSDADKESFDMTLANVLGEPNNCVLTALHLPSKEAEEAYE